MLSFIYWFKCRLLVSVYNRQLHVSQFRPTVLEYMIIFIAAYEKGFGLVLFEHRKFHGRSKKRGNLKENGSKKKTLIQEKTDKIAWIINEEERN